MLVWLSTESIPLTLHGQQPSLYKLHVLCQVKNTANLTLTIFCSMCVHTSIWEKYNRPNKLYQTYGRVGLQLEA